MSNERFRPPLLTRRTYRLVQYRQVTGDTCFQQRTSLVVLVD